MDNHRSSDWCCLILEKPKANGSNKQARCLRCAPIRQTTPKNLRHTSRAAQPPTSRQTSAARPVRTLSLLVVFVRVCFFFVHPSSMELSSESESTVCWLKVNNSESQASK